jgi:hypothetical protein
MSIWQSVVRLFDFKGRQLCQSAHHISPENKFHQALRRESARSDRNGQGFSLVIFEVENIHQPVTQALIEVLRYRLRGTDEAGWLGGQKYIGVILFATPQRQGAERFAQDIFHKISSKVNMLPPYQIYLYPKDWRSPDPLQEFSHKFVVS